jgi:hypothetical protein
MHRVCYRSFFYDRRYTIVFERESQISPYRFDLFLRNRKVANAFDTEAAGFYVRELVISGGKRDDSGAAENSLGI